MADLLISKPEENEHATYFRKYIDLVPDGDVLGTLAAQIGVTLTELRQISDAASLTRYAPGKWSVREMVGHMIDTERIFGYRALCIARNDKTNFPSFEQDDYIAAANFDERPWQDLIDEFYAVRRSNLAMLRGFAEEAWQRTGTSNNNSLSVRAAAYVIAGHERHHMGVLRERYSLESDAQSAGRPN
jgi:hypothetical protein